jgi:hypothetical protein
MMIGTLSKPSHIGLTACDPPHIHRGSRGGCPVNVGPLLFYPA